MPNHKFLRYSDDSPFLNQQEYLEYSNDERFENEMTDGDKIGNENYMGN